MSNVVKTKLCWSSKNKDVHACNALSFSVFIYFPDFLCNETGIGVCINTMTHHTTEQFSLPLRVPLNSAFCISAITGKKMNINIMVSDTMSHVRFIFARFTHFNFSLNLVFEVPTVINVCFHY